MTPPKSAHKLSNFALFGFPLFFVCAYLLLLISSDFYLGGNSWKQGDWLINSNAGPTRRFLSGDLLLFLSDITGESPLKILVAIQSILLIALFCSLYQLRSWLPAWLFFAFTTAPALFPAFWFADPQGSVRKELIIFFAIFLQLIAIERRSKWLIWVFVVLYAFAVFSHEALLCFFPLILYVNYGFGKNFLSPKHLHSHSTAIAFLSLSAFIFAFSFKKAVSADQVCEVLLSYNLSEEICSGAVSALDRDIKTSFRNINIWQATTNQIAVTILCFVPILVLLWKTPERRHIFTLFIFTGAPFVALYFLGIDWGRWLSFHFYSFFVAILVATKNATIRPPQITSRVLIFSILIVHLVVAAPRHTMGHIKFGVLERLDNFATAIFDAI